jgi:hypothetical protein
VGLDISVVPGIGEKGCPGMGGIPVIDQVIQMEYRDLLPRPGWTRETQLLLKDRSCPGDSLLDESRQFQQGQAHVLEGNGLAIPIPSHLRGGDLGHPNPESIESILQQFRHRSRGVIEQPAITMSNDDAAKIKLGMMLVFKDG